MTQTLYPVANSVGPNQVRETDDAYVIEDVPLVTNMELAGGYVPESSVRETADKWASVPATLNHPRDDRGQPVAANRQPELHLGTTEEPYYDGTHVRANLRVDKGRLDAVGGEADDIRRALESGDPIDVSSQYAAEPLSPGEYDGQHRETVERITRPDSVAILPNKTGVCSIEDGCGINPQLAANAEVSVPMTATDRDQGTPMNANADFSDGDLVRWSTSASPGTGRVNTVVTDPGATVSAEGADATREATEEEEAAYKLDNWVGPEYRPAEDVERRREGVRVHVVGVHLAHLLEAVEERVVVRRGHEHRLTVRLVGMNHVVPRAVEAHLLGHLDGLAGVIESELIGDGHVRRHRCVGGVVPRADHLRRGFDDHARIEAGFGADPVVEFVGRLLLRCLAGRVRPLRGDGFARFRYDSIYAPRAG